MSPTPTFRWARPSGVPAILRIRAAVRRFIPDEAAAHSTPLSGVVAGAGDEQKAALEREVCARWQEFATDGDMEMTVTMTTVRARK